MRITASTSLGSSSLSDAGMTKDGEDTWTRPGRSDGSIDLDVSANLGSVNLNPEDGCALTASTALRNDRVIAGVAGGLAYVACGPTPRSCASRGSCWRSCSGGIFLLVYIVMMIVVPLPPAGWMPNPGPPPPGGAWTAGPSAAAPPPGGAWTSPPGQAPGGTPPPGGQWTPPAAGYGSTWKTPDASNAGIVFGFILVGLGVWFLMDQVIDIDWRTSCGRSS